MHWSQSSPPIPATSDSPDAAEPWRAAIAAERRRLQEDHEALRQREENLRAYEARLHAIEGEVGTPRAAPATARVAPTPGHVLTEQASPGAAQNGWEKLHRAHEILLAEHKNLRDDRLVFDDLQRQLTQWSDALDLREQGIARREAEVAEQEKRLAAAASGQPDQPHPSLVTRLFAAGKA